MQFVYSASSKQKHSSVKKGTKYVMSYIGLQSLKSVPYCGMVSINPNWHEGGHFPHPCLFWIKFSQLSFFYQNFLEVKIAINRVNLTKLPNSLNLIKNAPRLKMIFFLLS